VQISQIKIIMSKNLEIIEKIENWQEIANYLITVKHRCTPENAKCARGRLNWWLNAEPNYASKKYMQAHRDQILDDLCKSLMPNFTLAQIFHADDKIGIDWHSDAAYGGEFAYLLNLGNSKFEIRNTETNQLRSLDLIGGELIRFNCKRPFMHRGLPQDELRIGIGMWSDKISMKDTKNWQ